MLKSLIHRILRRHHYWRKISFGEIAELYTSRLMVTFAMNVVNMFVAVYLYRLGYSVAAILLLEAGFFAFRALANMFSAHIVMRIGAKHSMLLAGVLRTVSLVFLLFVETHGIWMVVAFGLMKKGSAALDFLAYMIDFSKVKHAKHAGKELAVMSALEQITRVFAPILGGVLATFVSPLATIGVAAVLFLAAALPLLRTPEPLKPRKKAKIDYKKAIRAHGIDAFISRIGYGADMVTYANGWALFVMLAVFAAVEGEIYTIIGVLDALGVASSIIAAWLFGRMIDKHQSRKLLEYGTWAMSCIHISRAFITTPVGVAAVNILDEATATGAFMAQTRTVFDMADNSGVRIAFMALIEGGLAFGAALLMLIGGVLALFLPEIMALQVFFVIAGAVQLCMLSIRKYA